MEQIFKMYSADGREAEVNNMIQAGWRVIHFTSGKAGNHLVISVLFERPS